MKFYVGVTDDNWFRFLSTLEPSEVNFWRPSGIRVFRAVEPGAPFLFKLHSPNNYVVGGGFFISHTPLPLSLAWDCFGPENGAASLAELRKLILPHRRGVGPDPSIGCTILAQPFFFEREDWVPIPQDWRSNIVSGKTYDTAEANGHRLWMAVRERLLQQADWASLVERADGLAESPGEYGGWDWLLTKVRIGQGAFRVQVTDAYDRRCAMTGERVLPVLQACHIRPLSEDGPNTTSNGLLLRSDLHALFDGGYLTVTPALRMEVSKRIHDEYHNGKAYYKLHGDTLRSVPARLGDRPAAGFLSWHNEHVYVA